MHPVSGPPQSSSRTEREMPTTSRACINSRWWHPTSSAPRQDLRNEGSPHRLKFGLAYYQRTEIELIESAEASDLYAHAHPLDPGRKADRLPPSGFWSTMWMHGPTNSRPVAQTSVSAASGKASV